MAETTSTHQAVIDAQCNALIVAGLKDQLLLPTDELYGSRIDSWWSASSRLKPWCIVQPHNTEEVSKAIRALKDAGIGDFAVRSGGHSHWKGGSNIEHGVTIDFGNLNSVTYNPDTKLASIGPAGKWADVYRSLESQGVLVAGGRDGNVGVGGFLTGAGNSYFTGKQGFACDSLANAEVVLADGSIVNANAESNSDLWKALKGGSGNFGIVTRFDLITFPGREIWGGMRASAKTEAKPIIEALVDFTDNNHKNPEAAFIINFTYMPTMVPDVVIAHVIVDTDGVENAPVFENIRKIPELFSDIKKRPISGIAADYVLPAGLRNVWFSLTFKNDPRVVENAAELNENFIAELLKTIPSEDLVTQCLFQPLPKMFSDIGKSRGGNVLGLDKVDGNALLWLCTATAKTPEHEKVIHDKAAAFSAELDAYAKSIDASVPWIYCNYADPSQDALASYGEDNVLFMWEVSKKYDPEGLFQKRMRSGFKISEVK